MLVGCEFPHVFLVRNKTTITTVQDTVSGLSGVVDSGVVVSVFVVIAVDVAMTDFSLQQ